jgi:hypothetical protein
MRKHSVHDIAPALLVEPALTDEDWREYERGWRLFNEQEYWHAHEAWENVWKRRPEESRIFFQGIIQLAAALHLLIVKRRYGGMMGNFEKAEKKLRMFPPRFLGVDVTKLLSFIAIARKEILRIGSGSLELFNRQLLPVVAVQRISRSSS